MAGPAPRGEAVRPENLCFSGEAPVLLDIDVTNGETRGHLPPDCLSASPLNTMRRTKPHARFKRFVNDVLTHTPLTKMVFMMVVLWLLFSGGIYLAERGIEGTSIQSFGQALYWGVAAFSTAGIADTPVSSIAQLIGGIWIVLGSMLFFGAIVATITTYFMRPMQRPHKKIIETIEYNLEQLNDLTLDELDLLRDTVDTLISHVEELKEEQLKRQANTG
jgi:voltage-gated potassium channel